MRKRSYSTHLVQAVCVYSRMVSLERLLEDNLLLLRHIRLLVQVHPCGKEASCRSVAEKYDLQGAGQEI